MREHSRATTLPQMIAIAAKFASNQTGLNDELTAG